MARPGRRRGICAALQPALAPARTLLACDDPSTPPNPTQPHPTLSRFSPLLFPDPDHVRRHAGVRHRVVILMARPLHRHGERCGRSPAFLSPLKVDTPRATNPPPSRSVVARACCSCTQPSSTHLFFCFSPVLQHGLCRPRHLVQGLHVQAVGHQHLQLRFHRRAPLLHPPDDPLRGGHHLRGHASSHRQGAPRLSLFALHSSCVSRTIPPTPLTPDSAPSALFFSLRAGGVGDPPVQLAAGWALLPLVQPGGPSQSFD